jgi:4-hydroxy-tetrahydrodipicolinate synthase
MRRDDRSIDFDGLKRLIEFQVKGGINGIVVMGTTGESATLNWEDHTTVIKQVHDCIDDRVLTIAGTGSNSTQEALEGTTYVSQLGIKTALLVDPYYNGPSSLEIRREYVAPLAQCFPNIQFIPYVIPGRTGTQLFPPDLAVLHSQFNNVNAVKEATGDLNNMIATRKLCGDDFAILSGDDDKTYAMMSTSHIKANGVVSVISNVAPMAVGEMVQYLLNDDVQSAAGVAKALDPLFKIVTVKTEEATSYGPRLVKARNPLPIKTLMNVLGMPSGPCRQPLGKMTYAGLQQVLAHAREVYEDNSWVLEPVAELFKVDLRERLYRKQYWKDLIYD